MTEANQIELERAAQAFAAYGFLNWAYHLEPLFPVLRRHGVDHPLSRKLLPEKAGGS